MKKSTSKRTGKVQSHKNILNINILKKKGKVQSHNVEKKSFKEAAAEYSTVSAEDFFDALDERIKRRFDASGV